ncbi:MAG: DUF58 domain-containing protein [Omnitrophica WOR_2 bacterium]
MNHLTAQIRMNTWLLPILIGVVLVMELIDPFKGWVILLVGMGLLGLCCFTWARMLAKNLTFEREMRFGWAQVGDQLEERFTVNNLGWVPATFIEVNDQSDLPGYQASRVTGIEGLSQNRWVTHGLCTRRGIFTLGPTRLITGDPFGIFSVTLVDSASRTLTVMPPIVPLPVIEVAPGGRTGEGRPRSNAPERTVSAGSVREYTPGDNLRWIHWKTTARRDSPFVRIFDGTPAGDWWIFLDLDKKVQVGQGWDSTDENAIILAASLADRGIRMKRAVGLVSNGEELVWLPPREGSQGDAHRWEMMRALALVKPGERSLADLLTSTKPSIQSRTSLIVITANPGTDWIEALIPLLWRGIIPTVLLLDPTSFGSQQNTRQTMSVLAELGIARYLIPRQLLDRPEARPGQEGRWEWRVTPRGRAVPVRKPSDISWKALR